MTSRFLMSVLASALHAWNDDRTGNKNTLVEKGKKLVELSRAVLEKPQCEDLLLRSLSPLSTRKTGKLVNSFHSSIWIWDARKLYNEC